MQKKLESVGVIVPCYNYGRYLGDCVESVLSQEQVDVRVLIIDDASSDNTEEVGRALARADGRVEFRRHVTNKGHIATYNEGLLAIEEDFMVLLSADDLLTPGSLGRATDLMRRHPSVGLVYGHPITFSQHVPAVIQTGGRGETIWTGKRWIELMCRTGTNFINAPEVVMRTAVQKRVGTYRPDLPHSGDMEMWLRAAVVADVGRVNDWAQAFYRVHSQSMQRTIHAGLLVDLRGRYEAFHSALQGAKGLLPDADRMMRIADQAIAQTILKRLLEYLDHGVVGTVDIDECRRFAQSIYPDIVNSRNWRVLARRRRVGVGPAPMVWGRVKLRKFAEAVAWRRWQRTGVS